MIFLISFPNRFLFDYSNILLTENIFSFLNYEQIFIDLDSSSLILV